VNRLVDGAVVRTAPGRNSNAMHPVIFDLGAFGGRVAQLEIVDDWTGGGGQIGAVAFVFTDRHQRFVPVRPLDEVAAEFDVPEERLASWVHVLAGLDGEAPGPFAGGDMGLLSITTENDYIFGTPGRPFLPFVNLGLGYFKSFIDDATETNGSTTSEYNVGVYKGSFFGFHAGLGALINRDRFGVRLDANYVHLFAGGPDLEYFTVRGGIIFYM
jgi:hypothetical protein